MNLIEKITDKWSRLSKIEKTVINVLIIIILGVFLYLISFKIGVAVYDAYGK